MALRNSLVCKSQPDPGNLEKSLPYAAGLRGIREPVSSSIVGCDWVLTHRTPVSCCCCCWLYYSYYTETEAGHVNMSAFHCICLRVTGLYIIFIFKEISWVFFFFIQSLHYFEYQKKKSIKFIIWTVTLWFADASLNVGESKWKLSGWSREVNPSVEESSGVQGRPGGNGCTWVLMWCLRAHTL